MGWEELEERVRRWEERMNPEQRRAAEAIVRGWNEAGEGGFLLPIVDGPPGTGKTHVAAVGCAKYVLEARGRGEPEVAYLCKTNFACERAKQILLEMGFTFYPPSTTLPDAPLAVRIKAGEQAEQWEDGVVGWDNMSKLDEDFLKMHHILLVTVDSARKVHRMRRNPKMVVDEFSQVNAMDFFAAVERVCGAGGEQAPLLQGLALLGDPLQLPLVTTQSELRTNILHYLECLFHSRTLPRHRLKKQYRMNRVICEGVNMIREKAWNTYRLETAEEVANRRFEANLPGDLPGGIREALDPDHPLVLVDTSDLGDERRGFGQVAGDCSVSNPAEARLATELAWAAMRGTNPKEVRVLTPYSAQVRAIGEGLEKLAGPVGREAVSTVWRAQGQEWPCVIVSLVRSNDDRRLGFLGDEILKAQLYVAVSRAQAKLVVLAAHKRTFEGHKDMDALWETPGALKLRGKDLCR